MSIETWREQYAHLLEEVTLEHNYSDKAQLKDYERLEEHFDKDELGRSGRLGTKALLFRPQVRKNGARSVSRTVPLWFNNDAAVAEFLLIRFPKMSNTEHQSASCHCAGCRDVRGAALWYAVICGLRNNHSAEQIAREWSPVKVEKMEAAKPDITNEDPAYWEKILNSHGLAAEDHSQNDLHECPGHKRIDAAYVRRILQQIRSIAAGLRTDGKPRKGKAGTGTDGAA